MNQKIWSGITVTLITTVGLTTPRGAGSVQTVEQGSESPPTAQVRENPLTTAQEAVKVGTQIANLRPTDPVLTATTTDTESDLQPQVTKVGEWHSQSAADTEAIAKILAHDYEGRPAATVYVKKIPVLTFLEPPSDHAAKSATAEQEQPVWRATAIAATLNQLNRNALDAESIIVRWQAECDCYSIEVAGEELVQINDHTILPDTTRNLAEDALQATNRLRRLLGNAAPLSEIADLPKPTPPVAQVSIGPIRLEIRGMASWYGPGFHGRRSASGERFNQNALTAAHRYLPFGTKVQVTNLNNGQSVVVRINDRGPFSGGRVIDLSAAAARVIGMIHSGVAPVRLEVLDPAQTPTVENELGMN